MAQELEGVADAYRAPIMDYDEAPSRTDAGAVLYVVAPNKFLILSLSTLGLYSLYWFFKHWALQKRIYRLSIWPLARAIFSVFFAHALFRDFDRRAREGGLEPSWNANNSATIYVALTVISGVLSRLGNMPNMGTTFDLLSTGLALSAVVPMLSAQRVANLAAGDPEGRSNSTITAGNIVVIIIGARLWGLVILGLVAGDELEQMGEP